MIETIKVPVGVPEDLLEPSLHRSKGYSPSFSSAMYEKRQRVPPTGFEIAYSPESTPAQQTVDDIVRIIAEETQRAE